MTGGLVRASEADIVRICAHPEELSDFIDEDVWVPPVRQVRPKGILGLLLRLTPVTIEEVDPDATPPPGARLDPSRPQLDLDTAWLPLHFLLTGTAWEGDEPACYLVKGGQEIAEDTETFSSARALRSDDVRRFDGFLATLSHDDLRRRFDLKAMIAARIYSPPRGGSPNPDVEPLLERFDELRAFVAASAAAGDGLVVYQR
jgi:hypothetical protein